jgi:hypothetical protein
VALAPPSNRKVTVLADSVLLSGKTTIIETLGAAGWEVDYRGQPALMLKEAEATLASEGVPVGATVILGIGCVSASRLAIRSATDSRTVEPSRRRRLSSFDTAGHLSRGVRCATDRDHGYRIVTEFVTPSGEVRGINTVDIDAP